MIKNIKSQLLSGFLAITLNTLMLRLAKPLHIKAESGGLLKLVILHLPFGTEQLGFLHDDLFWYLFHYSTGAIMVLVYFVFFEKINCRLYVKGLLFSLFPWLINSLIVLPLLKQGIFGSFQVPASGIIYFFFANSFFGLSLAYINGYLKSK
jgi:hypothetical protein